MTVEELNQNIADHQATTDRLYEEMEELSRQFIATLNPFIAEWIPRIVESTVKENPGSSETLGRDTIVALKADMKELLENLPERIEARFSKNDPWPHHSPAYGYGHNPLYNLDEALKRVSSLASDLLIKWKYLAARGWGSHAPWDAIYEGSNSSTKDEERLVYYKNLTPPTELNQIKETYLKKYKQWGETRSAIADLEKQRSTVNVSQWWNEA